MIRVITMIRIGYLRDFRGGLLGFLLVCKTLFIYYETEKRKWNESSTRAECNLTNCIISVIIARPTWVWKRRRNGWEGEKKRIQVEGKWIKTELKTTVFHFIGRKRARRCKCIGNWTHFVICSLANLLSNCHYLWWSGRGAIEYIICRRWVMMANANWYATLDNITVYLPFIYWAFPTFFIYEFAVFLIYDNSSCYWEKWVEE